MYICFDNEGNKLAEYESEWAARTYWIHSVADCTLDPDVRENEITVFDKDHKEVGSIRMPGWKRD